PNLEKRKGLSGNTKGEGTVKQAGNEIRIDLKVNWLVDSKYANTDVVPRELQHVKDYHTFSNSFAKSLNSAGLRSLTGFPDKVKNFEKDQIEKYDGTPLRPNMPHNINEKYYPPRPFMLPTFENTNPYIPS